MKKTLFLSIVIFLAASTAVLAENTGCGLGTMVWQGKSGKGPEILAVTTNGTSYSQFFAITSGTSGYQDGVAIGYNDAELFINENMDMLASDMSKGDGVYLDTLADLLEVEDKDSFNSKLYSNYNNIYTHEDITSTEVLQNILKLQQS